MAHVVLAYQTPLQLDDERVYIAQACGRERDDGTWEGWLEFVPDDGTTVLRTQRETTQPTLAALEYWATGLTPVYLTGALERTLTPPPVVHEPQLRTPVYEAPAAAEVFATEDALPKAVLDPFALYARGEDALRRRLGALSARHLRGIVLGYDLLDPSEVNLEALSELELIELITVTVRERLAA
jgi:hypothetical protein